MRRYNYDLRFPSSSGDNRVKDYAKQFIKIAIFIVLSCVILKVNLTNKAPLPADDVERIVSNHGFQVTDITNQYYEKDDKWKSVLDKCIGFDENDIHFEYFVFNSSNTAYNVYKQAREKITSFESEDKNKSETAKGNYNVFVLDSSEKFGAATLVDDTVVYTYCTAENKNKISSVLEEMNYLNESSASDDKNAFSIDLLTNPNVILFVAVIVFFCWLAAGMPGLKKKKFYVKSIEKLESEGFVKNASKNMDYYERAESVAAMSKDKLSVEIAKYSSSAAAEKDFNNIFNILSKLTDSPEYTHKKRRKLYQEYAVGTGSQSLILCCDNCTVVLYSAEGNRIDELIKLNKHIK